MLTGRQFNGGSSRFFRPIGRLLTMRGRSAQFRRGAAVQVANLSGHSRRLPGIIAKSP
jgi:hypothetical protein